MTICSHNAEIAAIKEQITSLHLLLKEMDVRLNDRFQAQGQALNKAETASEKRFDSVNEFRAVLTNQQNTYATRIEIDAKFKAIEDKVNTLYESQLEQKGSMLAQNRLWAIFMGIIGLAGAIATIIPVVYNHK